MSFCGFLPLPNPRVTILVVLDEPAGKSWGGTHAAPIFRHIAQQVIPILGIAPDDAQASPGPGKGTFSLRES